MLTQTMLKKFSKEAQTIIDKTIEENVIIYHLPKFKIIVKNNLSHNHTGQLKLFSLISVIESQYTYCN